MTQKNDKNNEDLFMGSLAPWKRIEDEKSHTFNIMSHDANPKKIATIYSSEADAIITEAAPTLLAICKEVLACLKNASDRPYECNLLQMGLNLALGKSTVFIVEPEKIQDALLGAGVIDPDSIKSMNDQIEEANNAVHRLD